MDSIWEFFCKHDWELILENENASYKYKTYRCKKCGRGHTYYCG